MIEVSVPVATMLMVAFLACMFGFGRVLLRQFDLRVSERFTAVHEQAKREQAGIQELLRQFELRMSDRFVAVDEQIRKEQLGFQELRLEVKNIVRTLPIDYVRREDWIRFSAVIDTKLDRLLEAFHKSQQGGAA